MITFLVLCLMAVVGMFAWYVRTAENQAARLAQERDDWIRRHGEQMRLARALMLGNIDLTCQVHRLRRMMHQTVDEPMEARVN